MPHFRPIDRDTDLLLPPSAHEWLPLGRLTHYVLEAVEGLDLGDLERAYGGRGSAAFDPTLLLTLIMYLLKPATDRGL